MAESQETIIAYTTKHEHITTRVINELFIALEKVRDKFKNTIDHTSPFNTSIAQKGEYIYHGEESYPYFVKADMEHIEQSLYVPVEYSIQIEVPNALDYIYAGTLYNKYVDLINEMYNLCIHNYAVCNTDCNSVCSNAFPGTHTCPSHCDGQGDGCPAQCSGYCDGQGVGCPSNCTQFTWTYAVYEHNGVGYQNKCAADENCPSYQGFNTGYASNTGSYYSSYGGNGAYCNALNNGCDFYDPATNPCSGECGSEYGTYCRSHNAADQGCLCIRDCDSDCGSQCSSQSSNTSLSSHTSLSSNSSLTSYTTLGCTTWGSYSTLSSYSSLSTYSSHTSNSTWGSCSDDHAANYAACGDNCPTYCGSACMDNQGCACIRD